MEVTTYSRHICRSGFNEWKYRGLQVVRQIVFWRKYTVSGPSVSVYMYIAFQMVKINEVTGLPYRK
jgi:hypothetical protein